MSRVATGWLKPKPLKKEKRMSFLSVVYCGECKQLSSVSRIGRPCPKCGARPEHVVRANDWDFDNPMVRMHLGQVKTVEEVKDE